MAVLRHMAVGGLTALAAVQVAAATLTEVTGPVMVNSGSTYIQATSGMEVSDGYRVLALAGSRATLNYGECMVVVEGSQVLDVTEAAGCDQRLNYQPAAVSSGSPAEESVSSTGGESSSGGSSAGGSGSSGGAGGAGGAGGSGGGLLGGTVGGLSTSTVVGGTIFAGVIAVSVAVDQANDDDPPSVSR